jgi:3-deoxy-D-manno-octulosonic-acid transferase
VKAGVLLIDNMGMLSSLYRYAKLCYIGGGFNKSGIHNTLEAAVWGKPVLFGPQYKKFREAKGLVNHGAATSIRNSAELHSAISDWLKNKDAYDLSCNAAKDYVENNSGATRIVMEFIQANRLLTS